MELERRVVWLLVMANWEDAYDLRPVLTKEKIRKIIDVILVRISLTGELSWAGCLICICFGLGFQVEPKLKKS